MIIKNEIKILSKLDIINFIKHDLTIGWYICDVDDLYRHMVNGSVNINEYKNISSIYEGELLDFTADIINFDDAIIFKLSPNARAWKDCYIVISKFLLMQIFLDGDNSTDFGFNSELMDSDYIMDYYVGV